MEIVPVIDLKGGVVVRARGGERARYRPIETPLSPTAEPLDIVAGLLSLYPFKSLYIADLDAILGEGGNGATLRRIAEQFPAVTPWIDNGCCEPVGAQAMLAEFPTASLVLGSESQQDCTLLQALSAHPRVVLSLDFRGETFLGPPALLERPELWPARIILMSLAKVGRGAGPDFQRLDAMRGRAASHQFFLAGGLRGRDALRAMAESGAAGILVASALHDGRLTQTALAAFP